MQEREKEEEVSCKVWQLKIVSRNHKLERLSQPKR
jgi:hypothetical protein